MEEIKDNEIESVDQLQQFDLINLVNFKHFHFNVFESSFYVNLPSLMSYIFYKSNSTTYGFGFSKVLLISAKDEKNRNPPKANLTQGLSFFISITFTLGFSYFSLLLAKYLL